ncbi:MAG TPA: response regulator [Roseateles sp.]
MATEAKSRFLAEISHELRTPLNTIMGMTQLALQTPLANDQRDLLTKADAASRTLLGLVDNVLDVIRIEAGRVDIESQPLRLEDVVAQAIELVRPLHGNAAVALVCDWGKGGLLGRLGQLRGDAPRLRQVLVNLLSNALKSTQAGHVTLRLNAGAPDPEGRVPLLLSVQDSGIGMTAEQIATLFREFHPGDAAIPRPYGGTGLGLTLTRRLVELMGGKLEVQSEPGQGSRIDVSLALPMDAAASQPEAPPRRRLLLAAASGAGLRSTHGLLGHLGLADCLAVCTDAEATLRALDEARHDGSGFDWLLLDWQLPGPGPAAAELLARLRRDHPAVRVAVLAPPGLDAPARAFGARAICAQPLLPGEIRHLLADVPERPVPLDGHSLSGLRVLVVEDHPVNQEIALRLLGSRGAKVELAGNGQEGLDKLQAGGPDAFDLVLMDLQMPVLDGLSATRRLRELPGFEGLPVLAMTAHALAEERAECLAAGMQGHIAKPLDVARLMRELERYRPAPAPAPMASVLDVTLGLRQFDGQAALYRRTLRHFADQYAGGIADWPVWIANGEWAELRRAAHTLQGLGATLGAQDLHRAALALERSAAASDAPAAGRQFGAVAESLARLLEEIDLVLAEPADTPVVAQSAGDLAELRQLLAHSDSRALDWWQAHGGKAGLDASTRDGVDQALSAMDFDAALLALQGSGR